MKMKLDLTNFDKYVKDRGINPSDLLEDASTFDPRNMQNNDIDQRKGPAGNGGGQHFSNSCGSTCDVPDVIAKKFVESTINHIEDLSDTDDLHKKVDNLIDDMGTRLKHIFAANDEDGSIIYNAVGENIVAQIAGEIVRNNWKERISEKLRQQEKVLAAEIRNLMNTCQDDLTTWATLTASLSRDWGADASIIAGLTLAMNATAKTANWMYSKFMGAGEVNAGPIAQQFLNDNGVEDVFEAFGVEE